MANLREIITTFSDQFTELLISAVSNRFNIDKEELIHFVETFLNCERCGERKPLYEGMCNDCNFLEDIEYCKENNITKTFMDNPKAPTWDYKRNEGKRPFQILKSDRNRYWFVCEKCNHSSDIFVRTIKKKHHCRFCSSKEMCFFPQCKPCTNKSFSVHPKSKCWDYTKNKDTPRDYFKNNAELHWFKCDKCFHSFDISLNHVISGKWCQYCGKKKLCGLRECSICFNKSMASHGIAVNWDYKKNIKPPEKVHKKSRIHCYFKCTVCRHDFTMGPDKLSRSEDTFCPYCSGKRMCKDKECDDCRSISFQDHPRSEYWDYEKNNDIPRNVRMHSHVPYWFICQNDHSFQLPPHNISGQKMWCKKCIRCKSCGLFMTKKSDLCAYCKPASENKMYTKTKEMKVVSFLKDDIEQDFIHNKSVGKVCKGTHLYPDILFECKGFDLIVEVDEHKHRGSGYDCDVKRMGEITIELGLPCVFIRYNPDSSESDIDILLFTVRQYLSLEKDDIQFIDDFRGYKAEYLYY